MAGPFGDIEKVSKKVAQCRKNPKVGPFRHIRFCRLRLKGKKQKGRLFGEKENFRKKFTECQKNRKGDPLVPSGFVGYV